MNTSTFQFFTFSRTNGCFLGLFLSISICSLLPSQAEDEVTNLGPVIDDNTSELDATIVSAAPARSPEVQQTVRQATASRPVEIEVYDTLTPELITGGANETYSLPGSGYFVTAQDIRDQNYTNVNRVFAKVPGVYVREEDGSGLFPNISKCLLLP